MDGDFDALKREATAWIVRLTSGAATTEDGDALQAWRPRSHEHERAFREAAQLWKQLGPALVEEHRSKGRGVTSRVIIAGAGVAASAVGAAFVALELGFAPNMIGMLADHATAIGEQKVVTLPDGSEVILDGRSALSVVYNEKVRQVFLAEGAAVFDVGSANSRPFIVTAAGGKSRLSAAGRVSIAHAVNKVSVTCLNGDVEVDFQG